VVHLLVVHRLQLPQRQVLLLLVKLEPRLLQLPRRNLRRRRLTRWREVQSIISLITVFHCFVKAWICSEAEVEEVVITNILISN
jgi:hypothetical protein